jgi:hypothetical protein
MPPRLIHPIKCDEQEHPKHPHGLFACVEFEDVDEEIEAERHMADMFQARSRGGKSHAGWKKDGIEDVFETDTENKLRSSKFHSCIHSC